MNSGAPGTVREHAHFLPQGVVHGQIHRAGILEGEADGGGGIEGIGRVFEEAGFTVIQNL